MVQYQLNSTPFLFYVVLWQIFIQIGSRTVHVNLGNSGRPRLCVVLSPLWGALHYFPTATSEYPHIPSTFLSGLPHTEALYHITPPQIFPISLNDRDCRKHAMQINKVILNVFTLYIVSCQFSKTYTSFYSNKLTFESCFGIHHKWGVFLNIIGWTEAAIGQCAKYEAVK